MGEVGGNDVCNNTPDIELGRGSRGLELLRNTNHETGLGLARRLNISQTALLSSLLFSFGVEVSEMRNGGVLYSRPDVFHVTRTPRRTRRS